MKHVLLLLLSCFSLSLYSQGEFKNIPPAASNSTAVDLEDLRFNQLVQPGLPASQPTLLQQRPLLLWSLNPLNLPQTKGVKVGVDQETGMVNHLVGRPVDLPAARPDKTDAYAYLAAVAEDLGIDNPYEELIIGEPITDEAGDVHIRVSQQFAGYPVTQADAWIHASTNDGFDSFTGRLYPTPSDLELAYVMPMAWLKTELKIKGADDYIELPAEQLKWISGPQFEMNTEVYFKSLGPDFSGAATTNSKEQIPYLVYRIDSRPNLAKHTTTFVNAHTGDVMNEYSHICGFAAHGHEADHDAEPTETTSQPLPPDGPYTTTVQNLYDQNITINTFSISDNYLLIDGTRDMFTNNNGEIDGLLLTYEGGGGSPQLSNFDPQIASSLNNSNWTKTAASVHSNAGAAYQYFLDRHDRNSIDGVGGSVYSFMNINETDGAEMDNAFWNGRALFYGNGSQAFNRLPRGLDVAGHEMAHGVIQNTADLIYQEQPGALNESFADIFGYLVEGESGDFRIGENVVNTSVFTSGTMRDMQNPNNGAAGPQDFRWQPAHMDEYQDLPVNADNDNGGVHINSGIPNRAFYLFASHPAVGDTRAEKVYYLALSTYLTRSSRFADLRIAVVAAAQALYGADVVAAANAAFDGVGIGGDGGDYTEDLETNEGDRFLLATNPSQSSLFRLTEDGTLIDNPLFVEDVASKPSLTDDGEFAVFIDGLGRVRVYNLTTGSLTFLEQNPQTIWRNVAVSKGGNRLALTTNDNDNQVLIFDLVSGVGQNFTLFNPTSADGITTGDVLMSDVLEWDPSGEVLMYDAQSRLDEGLTFWDIGFLNAWNKSSGNFGDGNIFKLANNLPDDISIGNPTFSKNSPYIIAFERVNFNEQTYDLIGANIETGESNIIFENGVINYPNFGVDDDRMVFDAETTDGTAVLALVGLGADKISASGQATVLVNGGHWGIFYANGERDLDVGIEGPLVENDQLLVYPTVFSNTLSIEYQDGRLTEVTAQLFDLSGRLVAATVLNGEGAQSFPIGDLAAGTYVLAVTLEEGTVVQRVVRK